ncbi:MAG: hypothetical protein U9N34_10120, partial [Candidatus Cloacimonadota bacterium]|nr:hypothetical protein [Candidatus Cloacimonadota bacterium]
KTIILDYSTKVSLESKLVRNSRFHLASVYSLLDFKTTIFELGIENKYLSSEYNKKQRIFTVSHLYQKRNWSLNFDYVYKNTPEDEIILGDYLEVDENAGFNVTGQYQYKLFENISVGIFTEYFDYEFDSTHYFSPSSLLRFGVISNFSFAFYDFIGINVNNVLGVTNDSKIYENASGSINIDLKYLELISENSFVYYGEDISREFSIYISKVFR